MYNQDCYDYKEQKKSKEEFCTKLNVFCDEDRKNVKNTRMKNFVFR